MRCIMLCLLRTKVSKVALMYSSAFCGRCKIRLDACALSRTVHL